MSEVKQYKIEKTCLLEGIRTEMTFPSTKEQYLRYLQGNEYVQDIYPELPSGAREFLISGLDPVSQIEIFGDCELDEKITFKTVK